MCLRMTVNGGEGMSVFIPGMEMPQRCRDCCFVGFVFTCHLTGKTHNDVLRTRPDWCPLVEIKTPHGRLIDADALVDDLIFPNRAFEEGLRSLIGDAPTILSAEGGGEAV